MRTTLGVQHWQLEGRIGGSKALIRVDQPPDRCVSLAYTDPDGGRAVCTNTEQADIHIEIDDRQWSVLGTGHAEVGLRGTAAPRRQRKDRPDEFSARPTAAVCRRRCSSSAAWTRTVAMSPRPPRSACSSPGRSGCTTNVPGLGLLWRPFRAQNGRDFMWNSGVFGVNTAPKPRHS